MIQYTKIKLKTIFPIIEKTHTHICLLHRGITAVAAFQLWPSSAIKALTSTTVMTG